MMIIIRNGIYHKVPHPHCYRWKNETNKREERVRREVIVPRIAFLVCSSVFVLGIIYEVVFLVTLQSMLYLIYGCVYLVSASGNMIPTLPLVARIEGGLYLAIAFTLICYTCQLIQPKR